MKKFPQNKGMSREKKKYIKIENFSLYSNIEMIYKNYVLYAYAGPEATKNGKEEHDDRPHFHIYKIGGYSKENKRFKIEECFRINYENLKELNDKKIPKGLEKYLKDNLQEIKRRTSEVFQNGKCD